MISLGFERKNVAIIPPINIPRTKNKFQISFFHSYLKKGILAGIQEAQMCLKELEMPKDLFPMINKTGTVSPIIGPATYQGHGFEIISNILFISFCKIMNKSVKNIFTDLY